MCEIFAARRAGCPLNPPSTSCPLPRLNEHFVYNYACKSGLLKDGSDKYSERILRIPPHNPAVFVDMHGNEKIASQLNLPYAEADRDLLSLSVKTRIL
jgi:hypothetical protein